MANHRSEKSDASMTVEAAARIQRAEAKLSGGGVDRYSFASRAQRAAANNQQPPLVCTVPDDVFRQCLERSKIRY